MSFLAAVFEQAAGDHFGVWHTWGPILGSVGVVGSVVGLMVWLVRSLVGNEKRYAEQAISAEKFRADERVESEKNRANEWRQTAQAFEQVNLGLTISLKEALESNKITDHFFASYLPKPPHVGDNRAGEGAG